MGSIPVRVTKNRSTHKSAPIFLLSMERESDPRGLFAWRKVAGGKFLAKRCETFTVEQRICEADFDSRTGHQKKAYWVFSKFFYDINSLRNLWYTCGKIYFYKIRYVALWQRDKGIYIISHEQKRVYHMISSTYNGKTEVLKEVLFLHSRISQI